ncbi:MULTISPECIES: Lar family restriction alleviation protein [Gulbenkiania]|uniref:Restriction alleviation protein, Lar family n=2 Tax=Gulbenkiania TaxID=397456 RepID=A0A0K6GXJ7_9NEIS|nr:MULTISPECIES: Lar family restriction alleviation protein [Gulbenkiania]TCW33018.1 hypothetical protein EV669_102317 [Gulbenkiania mobilis]CUA83223.1 hypothetical protein Ga0061063_1636 [Gulbenkiania indica]
MTDTPTLQPKPCNKCGAPAQVVKTGSRRFWVQCSRYPDQGTCVTIGPQTDNRKDAILRWNATR